MSSLFKKIIVLFILSSFLTIVFFSFATMIHESDGNMSKGCLFSTGGTFLCPQDALIMVFHHVSSYQSFINVPTNFGITALVIFLLFIAYIVLIIFSNLSRFEFSTPVGVFYSPPQKIPYKRKITHWIALHENSPTIF